MYEIFHSEIVIKLFIAVVNSSYVWTMKFELLSCDKSNCGVFFAPEENSTIQLKVSMTKLENPTCYIRDNRICVIETKL